MKKAFLLLSIVAACTISPIASDECCASSETTVAQKLKDIDLTIALEKYKQIQTERAKTEVQLVMLETEAELTGSERDQRVKQLQNRIEVFAIHADNLRRQILDLSKAVAAN